MTTVNAANTYIVPTTNREVTAPSQPCFLTWLTADESNATGDGTVATVGAISGFTDVYDQNNDFSGTSFTAPVTGRYFLNAHVLLVSAAAATSLITTLVTSNRNYTTLSCNVNIINNLGCSGVSFQTNVIADMDAADTAYYTIVATGIGADTAQIRRGTTQPNTFFSGKLIV